ncbi:MAG: hypothetical protein ACTSRP_16460 [Candidatus Helarchaeota archaeon]
MNETNESFFPEIFEEKLRKCDKIKDDKLRHECKISVLIDAVRKIGVNQKPVQWWLEVIAEGVRPLLDKIRNEMATKDELNTKFNSLNVKIGLIREEMATKEDIKRLKEDIKKLDDGIGAILAYLNIDTKEKNND